MPKQKTHKGLSKRVKITASGKVKRNRCNAGHLMSGKTAKRRRRLRQATVVAGAKAQAFRTALGQ
jgi:large subunit ribosomal protein L35